MDPAFPTSPNLVSLGSDLAQHHSTHPPWAHPTEGSGGPSALQSFGYSGNELGFSLYLPSTALNKIVIATLLPGLKLFPRDRAGDKWSTGSKQTCVMGAEWWWCLHSAS